MKSLGIDFGTKRIGLAVSDDLGMIAFPHSIIENTKDAVQKITQLISDLGIGVVVVGKSSFAGVDNAIEKDTGLFIDLLSKSIECPIVRSNESFSSVEAVRSTEPKRAHTARKSAREEITNIDARAAAILLQRYLEQHHD